MKLRNELIKLIKENPYCTFVEICKNIKSDGKPVQWVLPNNVIIWYEVDSKIVAELKKLINEKVILAYPVPTINYIVDGITIDLPIAKRFLGAYTKQHWLPVGFKYIA